MSVPEQFSEPHCFESAYASRTCTLRESGIGERQVKDDRRSAQDPITSRLFTAGVPGF